MSAPTFTPEQIAYLDKHYGKLVVHNEVKRIMDTGLMLTEEVDKQASEHPKTEVRQAMQPQEPEPATPDRHKEEELPFNPELCMWKRMEGKNYDVCRSGTNFALLVKWLDEHGGKATVKGRFMWLFTRKDLIGWMLETKL